MSTITARPAPQAPDSDQALVPLPAAEPAVSPALPVPAGRSPDAADKLAAAVRDRIGWYNAHARYARIGYCTIKLAQVVCGALVPFAAAVQHHSGTIVWSYVVGGLGVLIVILEGVQQLYQFHENWLRYRGTWQALCAELSLFEARAGDYAAAPDALGTFAVCAEKILTVETAQWIISGRQANAAPATR